MCLMFMLAQILTEENLNHQSRDYHYSTSWYIYHEVLRESQQLNSFPVAMYCIVITLKKENTYICTNVFRIFIK